MHIKSFYGTSQNAVFSQIWIAICDYLLLAIAKKVYHVDQDLYILSAAVGKELFERKPLGTFRNFAAEMIYEARAK